MSTKVFSMPCKPQRVIDQQQCPENARFTGWEESDILQGGHSQMPCGGASHWPSQQMLSRWIRETWREGTDTETPACPSHISASSSWATAESGENISRGKKGVLSACRHEMHHVGSKTWACDKPCHADSMSSASFLELHQGCCSCRELERPETKTIIWQNRIWNDKKEIIPSILPFDRGYTHLCLYRVEVYPYVARAF